MEAISGGTLQLGDEVFHISDPSIIMRVESIENEMVVCSVTDPKTLARRSDIFLYESLRKAPQVEQVQINQPK
jgi:hypothetical protein